MATHSSILAWKIPWTEEHGGVQSSSVQSLSRVLLFATPWTAARQTSWFITDSWSLLKLMSIESLMPSNHLILCHPLLLLPAIFPSIRSFPMNWIFSSGGQSIGASASGPSNEYSGLNSFRIDWLDFLAVQGTLKSLLQHSFLYGPTLKSIHNYWKNP